MRLALIIILTILIAVIGMPLISIFSHAGLLPSFLQKHEFVPAPWVVPKKAGGSALSLAMVHDVIHERFYHHGPAWYEHRHSTTKRLLEKYTDPTVEKDHLYFSLIDDYAIECDRLGKIAEAIPLLRDKLNLLENRPESERPKPDLLLYTTCANLGTLLVHAHMKDAIANNSEAVGIVKEGLSYLEKAVIINPDAHFGRERWQIIAIRYLLAACEDNSILTTYDMMGHEWESRYFRYISLRYFSLDRLKKLSLNNELDRLKIGPRSVSDEQLVENIRTSIPSNTSLSIAWNEKCYQSFEPQAHHIPFDESTLAFVGIWTLGGGANPHLSLAFAHTMEGMKQWSIAWNAYERTCDLAEKFWPDNDIQTRLIDHCRTQQQAIEKKNNLSHNQLRLQHQEELAYGKAEKLAYQTYEAEKITAGHDPKEVDFYADFFKNRLTISSDPGQSDTVVIKYQNPWGWLLLIQAFVCLIILIKQIPAVIRRHRELVKRSQPVP